MLVPSPLDGNHSPCGYGIEVFEVLILADNNLPDVITALGDAFFPFYDAFRDSPFALFAFLAVLALVAIFLLARNLPAWFRMAAILVIFLGLAALGSFTIPPRPQVTVQDSQGAEPILSDAAERETGPRSEQIASSESQKMDENVQPIVQEAPFDNRDGFLLPRPSQYNDQRSWFTYVGSFSDKDRAVSHANEISDRYGLMTLVFLYGDRTYWGVALATWTSENKAKEAADFAKRSGIEITSYASSLPEKLFNTYPMLYDFSFSN